MKNKRIIAMAIVGAFLISGCSNGNNGSSTAQINDSPDTPSTSVSTQETDSGITNESSETKPVILTVSFGTSYNDSREKTIGAIEQSIADSCPDFDVRRAFTADTVINILHDRDNIDIDNVDKAFERLVSDGVKEVVIQPTHVMSGFEYDDLKSACKEYSDKFKKISIGEPLLTSDEDYSAVADALIDDTKSESAHDTAIVFMGHGTEHSANTTYSKLQDVINSKGITNIFIGTVEAEPGLDDIETALKAGGFKKVILQPLMVVAGDHANNDMAGDDEDSWKSVLTADGYEVECNIKGLGEIPAIRDIYVAHAKAAINNLNNSAADTVDDTSSDNSPVSLSDGTYTIDVESSSSMFKIEKCELTVNSDEMTAKITLSGKGYGKLFMGTGEEASAASESEYIPYTEDSEGKYVYEIPVKVLDAPIQCAAWSTKKEQWYDRELIFKSETAHQ